MRYPFFFFANDKTDMLLSSWFNFVFYLSLFNVKQTKKLKQTQPFRLSFNLYYLDISSE